MYIIVKIVADKFEYYYNNGHWEGLKNNASKLDEIDKNKLLRNFEGFPQGAKYSYIKVK